MKYLFWLLSVSISITVLFTACKNENQNNSSISSYQCPMKCEGDKLYPSNTSCPICKMDLKIIGDTNLIEKTELAVGEITSKSIFNLSSKWKTQDNQSILLEDLRGEVLVMVMIYTSCKAACPRLVADMRNINAKVNDPNIRFVLISINPEVDTPKRLKEFAIKNEMDADQWTFLQGSIDDVREFSNVLAVKYKQISPIDFSHSNIISIFNKEGELYHQQEGLGVDNEITVSKIQELAKSSSSISKQFIRIRNDREELSSQLNQLPEINIKPHQLITSPLTVKVNSKGKWFASEGELGIVRLIGHKGLELDKKILISVDGNWMTTEPALFKALLNFDSDNAKTGKLIITSNPGNGDDKEAGKTVIIEIPIKF